MSKFIFDNENGEVVFINPKNPELLCCKRIDEFDYDVIAEFNSKLIDLNNEDKDELYAMDEDGVLYVLVRGGKLRRLDRLC